MIAFTYKHFISQMILIAREEIAEIDLLYKPQYFFRFSDTEKSRIATCEKLR